MKYTKRSTLIVTAAVLLIAASVLIASMLRREATDGEISEPVQAEDSSSISRLAAADEDGDGIVYQDGMHPWIVRDEPGTCPICGMDLTPVRVDETSDPGVRIDPTTLQNIGVRTAPVVIEPMQRSVRTTGRMEVDEQQTAVVSPKIGGWIDELYVDFEGARVTKGQPLLEIYSPELVSTQEEYLLALRNRERMQSSPAAGDADRLLEAARRRLEYWDISTEQIRRLEETGTPRKTLTLYAPATGTVVSTSAVEGRQVTAGETLMHLSNQSTLWLMVDVYEQDVSWLEVGTEAAISLPYDPGVTITGTVSYVYDVLDPETRSAKARISIPNPGFMLKPGMYATVTLMGRNAEPAPSIPVEAVIRSGDREIVILALGEGRFAPAPVVTGVQSGDRVQVLSGLQGGEEVVTSAQFLIDSEARLQSAVGAMASGDPSSGSGGGPIEGRQVENGSTTADPHAGH